MNMHAPVTAEVIDFTTYKQGRNREKLRRELVISFKNPLMQLSRVELQAAELRAAADLLLCPNNVVTQLRWELLKEVKNG